MSSKYGDILNVTDAIFSKRSNELGRPAIYYKDEIWTYRRLIDEINRVGNALKKFLEREQRLLMISYDSPYFISVFYGAMKIGAFPIPVNTFTIPDDHIFYLEDSKAKVLVVEPEIWDRLASKLNGRTEELKYVMILPGGHREQLHISPHPAKVMLYEDIVPHESTDLNPAKTSPDEPAFGLYTSGSTGHPKCAVHLHKDIIVVLNTYVKNVLKINENDKLFSASKLFFAYGLGNSSYFAFGNGASVVLMPERVEPKRVLHYIQTYKPTIFFAVPTIYNSLLNVEEWKKYDLSSIRLCVSAGEPLPGKIYEEWKKRYVVEILDGIGSTEALHIYISNFPGESRPNCTGKVVPGYEVKIVDENGNQVKAGEIGDLYVKGDSVAMYYLHKYEDTRKNMQGYWFRSGDKFYFDDNGYLYYIGRSDDMIKAGGMWISPIEVESVILTHEAVLEAAVVGIKDEVGLTKVVAFVVPKQGYEANEKLEEGIKEYLKGKLPSYKIPKQIRFVNELPKTATGKIQRYKFRTGEVKS
ncbi:benzoate-CoA ligase family protein [Sulfolobus acidocaldarius]|uniref:Acetyl-coenzyme A synthetase n=4 Tax=Sulfolobus acidocaldarius TaxID=2285 RepID=Q4J801_SULAC|nr:benzoate-CoA ligase family protein [Sulfolobus acidocaldarius]AAY81080.1 acetyl-coenzyme A synthetase [Sulfolobus acidocaldarius DSM 639]AGE71687.1 acetyl-coenzyme A synthetase [Sulfolobus acidocaldarius N8]AGE73960.1 acetyl-coenzyme A synthetase [Sulfolobus acidocaldarius Ron12/I]ALU30104.1 4-hydroxybenzoate--CoA ligase [Sulfolobus acidocaldarius]ALU30796.1 4-hydroxybenzoate--CoA ligase [Sulfolobus acidocaldarius]